MYVQELRDWFGADELETCPRCSQTAALAVEDRDVLLCFHCGFLRWPGGETTVDELQAGTVALARAAVTNPGS
jgi:ribosomal protein S27AE